MSDEAVRNVKALIHELNKIQPKLANKLRAEAKAPAKPLISKLKIRINKIVPLSGMLKGRGRLVWGAGKPADHTSIKFNAGYSRTRAITSLVSIWVDSPMTSVADIAGKGSNRKAKTMTKSYEYRGGTRKHRIGVGDKGMNGGSGFVQNLRSHGMNNFVYPEVEQALPDVEREIKLVIRKFEAEISRKF
jgi:hypothetical protein